MNPNQLKNNYLLFKSFEKMMLNLLMIFLIGLCTTSVKGQTFTTSTPGLNTYTIPAGITSVNIQIWGSGASGGGSSANNNSGSGGGGGGYATKTFTVTPGDIITYTIGAGATAGTIGSNGNNGNTSTLIHLPSGNSFTANGGTKGNANSPTGGTGGTATGGTTNTSGANGASGGNAIGGNGGNGGNTTGTGGNGVSNGNGQNGTIPGGGGGGGERGGVNQSGGSGANGQVIITCGPTISNLLTASNGCPGSTITITGTNLSGAVASNVKIGGTPVTAILSNTATQIVATIGAGTTGTVSVTTIAGTATSIGVFTINPTPTAPTISSPASPITICNGTSINLNATSAGNTIYWYTTATGGTSIGNSASGVNFSVAPTTSTTYYAESRNASGCASSTRTATALVTVISLTTPTVEFTQGQNDTTYTLTNMCGTITGGGQNDLDIATGNPGGSSTYQWQVSYDNGVNWVNAPGPSSTLTQYVLDPTYTIYESVAGVYKFRIIITNNGCSVTSSAITLTTVIGSNLTSGSVAGNQTFCAATGNPVAFTQTVAPTGGNGTFTYQWQSSTDNINFTNIAGATASTYDPPLLSQTTYYRRYVVTGGCGAYSNTITIIIGLPSITLTATSANCYSTIAQTTSLPYTATTGSPATYSITWNTVPPNSFVAVSNTSLPISPISISIPASTLPGTYTGNLIVKNTAGCSSNSVPFTVTINPLPTTPTITAGGPTAFCSGGNIILTSSVGTTYLWSNGATTQSITVTSSGSYFVKVTNANGCQSIQSLSTIVSVSAPPVAPDIETVTQPTCAFTFGSVHFHDLPSGTWTLNQYGTTTATIPGSGNNTTITNITPGNYYFTITNSAGCTSSASNNVVFYPLTTTTWNGSSWSNGVPDIEKNIVFTGSYSSAGNLSGCTCTINSGDIVFNPSNALTITNEVNVNGGTLTFENNSSLIQISNTAVNTGAINYKRNATIKQYDYVYWSSPVENFNINNISTTTPLGPKYEWNPTVANGNNGQGNWQVANGNPMIAAKGYIARAPSSFTTTPASFYGSFVGKPNNGIIPIQISRGSITGAPYNGTNGTEITNLSDNWNLIGNPYPSSVRANQFLVDNQTAIEGNVRLWTHGTLPSNLIASPYYGTFVYNYNPGDYLTYNFTGASCCPAAGPEMYIGAGQGFFVQMKDGPAGSTNVTFNNGLRNETYDNSTFYKSNNTNNSIEKHRIWLDIVSANNQSERTLIGYIDGASNAKDTFFDASYNVSNTISIYSLITSEKYNIQGRQLPFDDSDTVAIGVNIVASGTYNIAIADVDGLFENQNIYLEDTLLNSIHNLKLSPYSFTSTVGTFNNRFVLRYTTNTLSADTFNIDDNIAFIKNRKLEIQTSQSIKQIDVFDISGKLLKTYTPTDSKNNFESEFNYANGVYFVKVKLENDIVFTQKLMN